VLELRVTEPILNKVEQYYTGRFAEHGPTARGVDWNSTASQELRFAQLLKVREHAPDGSTLNDYGCGYGALVPMLARSGHDFTYRGFDVSRKMLSHAKRAHEHPPSITFTDDESDLDVADFTVASGIFNVKLDVPEDAWRAYVLHTIDTLAGLSSRGFAFNMLTTYSDADKMRPDLYYGDPRSYFDYLKRRHSRNVSLLHDYGLYEFTMIVRRDE
jgi:SAM-dependent methyltransferase